MLLWYILHRSDLDERTLPRPSRRHPAFTLVELLVVIAIIALLIAILLPTLNKARDQANFVECASNMRQIGQAMAIFAQDHDGRYPMQGTYNNGNNTDNWMEILNRYSLGANFLIPDTTPSLDSNITKLACPAAYYLNSTWGGGNNWSVFMMNGHAAGCENGVKGGGGYVGVNYAPPNVNYGRTAYYYPQPNLEMMPRLQPASSDPNWNNLGYTKYALGTKASLFCNSSEKFLVQESMAGNLDYFNPLNGNNFPPTFWLDQYPASDLPWTANEGFWAFRHLNLTTMNMLYMDGHVDGITATHSPQTHPLCDAWRWCAP